MTTRVVSVYKGRQYEDDWPSNPTQFVEFLQQKINKIPEEWRSVAHLNIDGAHSYECSCVVEMEIWYSRPETDQERANRERLEMEKALETERTERRQLERLRAKYG